MWMGDASSQNLGARMGAVRKRPTLSRFPKFCVHTVSHKFRRPNTSNHIADCCCGLRRRAPVLRAILRRSCWLPCSRAAVALALALALGWTLPPLALLRMPPVLAWRCCSGPGGGSRGQAPTLLLRLHTQVAAALLLAPPLELLWSPRLAAAVSRRATKDLAARRPSSGPAVTLT